MLDIYNKYYRGREDEVCRSLQNFGRAFGLFYYNESGAYVTGDQKIDNYIMTFNNLSYQLKDAGDIGMKAKWRNNSNKSSIEEDINMVEFWDFVQTGYLTISKLFRNAMFELYGRPKYNETEYNLGYFTNSSNFMQNEIMSTHKSPFLGTNRDFNGYMSPDGIYFRRIDDSELFEKVGRLRTIEEISRNIYSIDYLSDDKEYKVVRNRGTFPFTTRMIDIERHDSDGGIEVTRVNNYGLGFTPYTSSFDGIHVNLKYIFDNYSYPQQTMLYGVLGEARKVYYELVLQDWDLTAKNLSRDPTNTIYSY